MSKCMLYVGGLSEAASDHQLRHLLGSYGTVVQAYVIRYKRSKKSAGYGFAEMGSKEEAVSAVAALDGTMFEDNRLRLFLTTHEVTSSSVR